MGPIVSAGIHARPPAPRGESLWRPLTLLALVGLGPPAAIVFGAVDAHAAPVGISIPDRLSEGVSGPHTDPPHSCRCGPRPSP